MIPRVQYPLVLFYDWAILSPHGRGRIFDTIEGLMHIYVWRLAVLILLCLTISRLRVPFRLSAQVSDASADFSLINT